MKNLILIFLFLLSLDLSGQRIKENYIDEFTGQSKVSTSWSNFIMGFSSSIYQRVIRIDNNTYLNLKVSLGLGKVFAVADGAKLLLKLQSDTVITLNNLEYTITSIGGGAYNILGSRAMGASLYFLLSDEFVNIFSNFLVKKMRLYTTDGYYEKEIVPSYADKLKTACNLIKSIPAPEKKNLDF
ncbi:MAG: hypothetical protein ISR57_00095 [Bacteroidales bacterium]|nr:hypothetical protein [Bacteroidales bacterium]